MKRTIGIIGPIGSFMFKGKEINGIELVDIVAQVSSLPKETTELVVEYDTPGGRKDVGQAIYNYLKSIQPRIQVTSKQIGNIGSIGTVAWFSGTKRIAMKGKEFMIHNPWTAVTGDAGAVQKVADELKTSEDEMAAFYSEQTGITKEGLAPLMKAETSFGADKAVELKFATEVYAPQSQVALHNQNNNAMEKSLIDKILALLGKAPVVATAPPAELMGKPVLIDGKPAVDGKYTVVGGVITLLEEAPAASPAPAVPPGQGAAAPPAAMAEIVALLKAQPSQEAAIAAAVKATEDKFKAEIVALKKSITTPHVPAAFTPETKADDVKEWDRSWKANEHMAMKKEDPEKYQRIFYAKFGKMPNM
jgi:ATP-dependent protease ClpP protease subunit